MTDFSTPRHNMVEGQIRPNRVTDEALIAAMETIPRERFVPRAAQAMAYVDEDVPIGHNRFLMEPMVFARLVNESAVGRDDTVLDVGAGYGYSTIVLARLAKLVVGLEVDSEFADRAQTLLTEMGADNAVLERGPLEQGFQPQAPYSVILVNGAVAEPPQALLDQLADGGRLAVVVRRPGDMGRATLFQRIGNTVSSRILFDASTPTLQGFEAKPTFVF